MENAPEQDELVLATIKKIMPYGAFCTLDEYAERESFLHISEVAPRWIKNIHEFLREGQKVVAKVYRIVEDKNQIDLSLKRVSEAERKRKLETAKREKRSEKLFELCVATAKLQPNEAQNARDKLLEKFGDLFDALEAISDGGEGALAGIKLDKGFVKALVDISQKNIKKPKAIISGTLSVICYAANGIDLIKDALTKAKSAPGATAVEVSYIGAPRYQLKVEADDFKTAEKAIDAIVEAIESALKGTPSEVSFAKKASE